jgi:hypothetical protein
MLYKVWFYTKFNDEIKTYITADCVDDALSIARSLDMRYCYIQAFDKKED